MDANNHDNPNPTGPDTENAAANPNPETPAAQGFNPFAGANTENTTPTTPPQTFNPLTVEVASPTHFEQELPPQPNPIATKNEPDSPAKATKRFTILSIVLGVLAVVFLGLAIWGMIFGLSNQDKVAKLATELNTKSAIIAKVEEDTSTTITSAAAVPAYTAPLGYIYIGDWNIKLKVPDNLTAVSYILNTYNYRNSICFNAYQKGTQYAPAFADIAQNPGGMGCLQRVPATDGNNDSVTGLSFGQKVYTYQGFNFFYTAPDHVFSQDTAEQGLEATAVQLIKNMIVDNISTYE